MNIILKIKNQYFEIETIYAKNEFEARANGLFKREDYWRYKRELNTHSYYVFLFSRLEDHIRTETINLIETNKVNIPDWKSRSIWDITDSENLHFMKRVALLTQKGYTDYNKIKVYYDIRNTIAHGGTITGITGILNMIDVFKDFKYFIESLKK